MPCYVHVKREHFTLDQMHVVPYKNVFLWQNVSLYLDLRTTYCSLTCKRAGWEQI